MPHYTACMTVPRVEAGDAYQQARRAAEPARSHCSDATFREVLLVDDDAGFVETLRALLEREGLVVIAKGTYATAVQYLSSHTPDVLITDTRLGSANGWDLAKYAKRLRPELPVIVVTAWCSAFEAEIEYFELPIFLKPFEPDDLLTYLRSTVWVDQAALRMS
jgi:DNA-binding NtrC family response regulator